MDNAAKPRLSRLKLTSYALENDVLARVMSPALIIYEDKVKANVQQMLRLVGSQPRRWRVHLKTTKIPEVYSLLVDAGLRHFKCATVREAKCMLDVLDAHGVEGADLTIAYPMQGPALTQAARLAAKHPHTALSVLSEDVAHVDAIDAKLGVFVDVNPGMNRTGIPMAQSQRVLAVARAAGERMRGVHFYDGHIHDDDAQGRRRSAHAVYDGLSELLALLVSQGIDSEQVITSGTPSFRYALDYPGFANGALPSGSGEHQVSPGTVVFHDFQYDELLEDLELEPAAVVMARVVSHPREDMATCDAGSKSIAAECGNPVGFAIGHPELIARGPSEEHLPMTVTEGAAPALGESLYWVPRHVCPTVNLAEQALLVKSDGAVTVVDVRGRAHELLLNTDA